MPQLTGFQQIFLTLVFGEQMNLAFHGLNFGKKLGVFKLQLLLLGPQHLSHLLLYLLKFQPSHFFFFFLLNSIQLLLPQHFSQNLLLYFQFQCVYILLLLFIFLFPQLCLLNFS